MTDTERSFLAAITADPADDLNLEMYADWCEDSHQPDKAQFVREQLALRRRERARRRRRPQ